MKKYDLVVYIGRFQPFHNAHLEILKQASEYSDNILVIIGSAEQPRTYKNPFSEEERSLMILQSSNQIIANISVENTHDSVYNDQAWVSRIQEIVYNCSLLDIKTSLKIAVIGHEKDESSFYLKMFPQWDLINVGLIEPLHSTNIRDLFFRDEVNLNFIKGVVPSQVYNFLEKFKETQEFNQIVKERKFITSYKKQFEGLQYPPVFVTTDAVVVQSGHVLMIKRKSEPGKGLWALPGGFLNSGTDRSLQDCMIRELKEETGIKVPVPVLIGNIKNSKIFDAINRSARGRTITNAFYIQLPDGELPKVKGMDDAEKAKWIPLGKLKRKDCFEDHKEIIDYFIGG